MIDFTQFKLFFLRCLIVFFFCSHTISYAQNVADSSSKPANNSLLLKLEQVNIDINSIAAANQKIVSLKQIRNNYLEVKESSFQLQADINRLGKADMKTLLNYQVFIKDLQQKLDGSKTWLAQYASNLKANSDKLIAYSNDSSLNVKGQEDNTEYTEQLNELKIKIRETGKKTLLCLDTVNNLQTEIASLYLKNAGVQAALTEQLSTVGKSSFKRESPYIWKAPINIDFSLSKRLAASYKGQNKIISYFIEHSWDNRLLLLFLGLCYFVWVFRNFRLLQQSVSQDVHQPFRPQYINRLPVLETIIIILNLAPLIEQGSPAVYIEIIEFLLLISLSIFFWKHWDIRQFYIWLIVVSIYLVISITNAIVSYGIYLRSWLIIVNIMSIYFGLTFFKGIKNDGAMKQFIKPVSHIYILLNIVAVLFNVFGRISIAKLFSTTACMALSQIIGLSAFVHIMTESLDLQMRISAQAGGLLKRFNSERICNVFTRIFTIIAVVLWLVVFFINLNIFEAIYAYLTQFFTKERTVGSLSFTIGNISMFVIIIYISNFLQKNVPTFFGEEQDKVLNSVDRKASKLVLIKLVIFIIGFLLAIMSLGLPLDKLTVILGALSVGIGLGLQNIVNNFVSGIILIFEKPFQIGDYIEIGDKSGRVQDIGIRSSRITTQKGSEVIVPNGDLLSGRLVNWTLSNSYLKTEMLIKVNADAALADVSKIVNEITDETEGLLKNSPIDIVVNTIAAEAAELKISFWITDIYSEATIKSQIIQQLYSRFKEKGIKLL